MRILGIAFLLLTKKHVIHYVSKNTHTRYKGFVDRRDVYQETWLAFHEVRPFLPIENDHIDIKRIFRKVGRRARDEKRHRLLLSLDGMPDIRDRGVDGGVSLPQSLDPLEREICRAIVEGSTVMDVLLETGMPFQEYVKTRNRIRKKWLEINRCSAISCRRAP
jgi:hypothetical protein